jgi:hypothetical protein
VYAAERGNGIAVADVDGDGTFKSAHAGRPEGLHDIRQPDVDVRVAGCARARGQDVRSAACARGEDVRSADLQVRSRAGLKACTTLGSLTLRLARERAAKTYVRRRARAAKMYVVRTFRSARGQA